MKMTEVEKKKKKKQLDIKKLDSLDNKETTL